MFQRLISIVCSFLILLFILGSEPPIIPVSGKPLCVVSAASILRDGMIISLLFMDEAMNGP